MKLKLPSFSGDMFDWYEFPPFLRLFHEGDLNERISCFKTAMQDPDVKAVEHLKIKRNDELKVSVKR